jgi:hypothetical protein
MTLPLMPKATAVWLIDKTALTFEQVADFCGMHPLEIQAIADGEVAQGIMGYDPVANRNDRPDAIAFVIRNFPQLSELQIGKLLGTTKETIQKVRERSHWNSANIKPRDPVILGLCKQSDLNAAVAEANERLTREGRAVPQPPPPEADAA